MNTSSEILELVEKTPFFDTHEHLAEESTRLQNPPPSSYPPDFSVLLTHYADSDLIVAGMTPAEREHTTDLLKRAAEKHAVVVVEHDMEFIRRLDCRVTVLCEGSVLAEGSLDHVTSNPEVIEVYLGR